MVGIGRNVTQRDTMNLEKMHGPGSSFYAENGNNFVGSLYERVDMGEEVYVTFKNIQDDHLMRKDNSFGISVTVVEELSIRNIGTIIVIENFTKAYLFDTRVYEEQDGKTEGSHDTQYFPKVTEAREARTGTVSAEEPYPESFTI